MCNNKFDNENMLKSHMTEKHKSASMKQVDQNKSLRVQPETIEKKNTQGI